MRDSSLRLSYTRVLDPTSVPAPSAYSVVADGSAMTVSAVSIDRRIVTLALANPVTAGQTVTVSYTVPTGTATMQRR